jgi:ubiquinone biosynthesis monooxygenase Coq7
MTGQPPTGAAPRRGMQPAPNTMDHAAVPESPPRDMTNHPRAVPLPGDLPADAAVHRMIRVDHAGEYGAARIYAGQLAVLGRSAKADLLRHMQDQEQVHLDTFNTVLADRRVRPTALLPFWHLAGFALGAATAALGERAAMACTVAVEETIDAHYTAQIDRLTGSEAPLRDTLTKFRAEEREHRDIALANDAEQAPGYRLLSAAIRTGCRIAIRLSERL